MYFMWYFVKMYSGTIPNAGDCSGYESPFLSPSQTSFFFFLPITSLVIKTLVLSPEDRVFALIRCAYSHIVCTKMLKKQIGIYYYLYYYYYLCIILFGRHFTGILLIYVFLACKWINKRNHYINAVRVKGKKKWF